MTPRSVILVLGAPVGADRQPGPAARRRLELALELARRDPSALVVVSGGAVVGPAEGPAMAAWLTARGVAATRVLVEPRARTTAQNIALSLALLDQAGVAPAPLSVVTERFHMPRTRVLVRELLGRRPLTSVHFCAAADDVRGLWRALMPLLEQLRLLHHRLGG